MTEKDLRSCALFDLRHTLAAELFLAFRYPWEILPHISKEISYISTTIELNFIQLSEGVFVHRSASIASSATLHAPCIICARAQVRCGAYLRGGVLVGEDCVVGNSVELKNCILFDGVQIPHLSYVGDSVLGYQAHLGAGAIVSNLRADKSPVTICCGGERIATGLKKCGAFLGDHAEAGCNAVLNPGVVLGRRARVFPLVSARGFHPADRIVKDSSIASPPALSE